MDFSISDFIGTFFHPGKFGDVTITPFSVFIIPGEPMPAANTLFPFFSSASRISLILFTMKDIMASLLRPAGTSIFVKCPSFPSFVTAPRRIVEPPRSTPITDSIAAPPVMTICINLNKAMKILTCQAT